MELDFDNDEFESFLKQKADQYKMYPSERVWKGIAFVQHSRTRLITIGGSLLLISVFFFFGGRFLTDSDTTRSKPVPEQIRITTSLSSANASTQFPVSPENARRSVVVATDLAQKNEVIDADSAEKLLTMHSTQANTSHFKSLSGVMAKRLAAKSGENKSNPVVTFSSLSNQTEKTSRSEAGITDGSQALKSALVSGDDATISLNSDLSSKNIAAAKIGDLPPVIDLEEASDKTVNWLQEIAAIKLTTPKRSAFNVQFYFSPMVSYRKLVDNTGLKTGTASNATIQSGTVSRFVDHKPAIGVELGSNVLYSPMKNLTIKTGVQLNYSRYTIKAYKSYVEKASIALNSTTQHTRDTMVSYTTVRNFNGYSPEVLENQYLQVSIPVGAELVVFGKKKLQFSVAGTVQPTYLIFNDSYLLTTDYQHYTKEPSLIRKWNVHTSAEAFVSYKIGSLRWQVGPQFRYQLMSSYNDRYPIKEYLMEYGIKFGLSKTIK